MVNAISCAPQGGVGPVFRNHPNWGINIPSCALRGSAPFSPLSSRPIRGCFQPKFGSLVPGRGLPLAKVLNKQRKQKLESSCNPDAFSSKTTTHSATPDNRAGRGHCPRLGAAGRTPGPGASPARATHRCANTPAAEGPLEGCGGRELPGTWASERGSGDFPLRQSRDGTDGTDGAGAASAAQAPRECPAS